MGSEGPTPQHVTQPSYTEHGTNRPRSARQGSTRQLQPNSLSITTRLALLLPKVTRRFIWKQRLPHVSPKPLARYIAMYRAEARQYAAYEWVKSSMACRSHTTLSRVPRALSAWSLHRPSGNTPLTPSVNCTFAALSISNAHHYRTDRCSNPSWNPTSNVHAHAYACVSFRVG